MSIQEICRERKAKLGMTTQTLSDMSGIPVSTINNFFANTSKAPSVQTAGAICAVLGVSLDEFYGIGDRLTANEEVLQERADGLEHRLANKRQTIGLMETELHNLRHSVGLYRWIIFGLSMLVVGLIVWCVWVDIHCADYGFWRG